MTLSPEKMRAVALTIRKICQPERKAPKRHNGHKRITWFVDHVETSREQLAEILGCVPRNVKGFAATHKMQTPDGRAITMRECWDRKWTPWAKKVEA